MATPKQTQWHEYTKLMDSATGNAVPQKSTNGRAHVTYSGEGTLETRDITIDAAGDLFTDPTAPVAAELVTIDTITAGKKHCRITWHCQAIPYVQSATSDIPVAAFGVATINASDDANAIDRLTLANTGVGDLSTNTRKRMFSAQNPVIEWDFSLGESTVDRVDLGFIPPTDTGAIPVYVSVEIW